MCPCREATCEEPTVSVDVDVTTDEGQNITTIWTTIGSTSSEFTESEMFQRMLVIITVPAATLAVGLFVCLLVIVGCCCVCQKRRKTKMCTHTSKMTRK